MASSSKKDFQVTSRSTRHEWISEIDDPKARNAYLSFPDIDIKNHSTNKVMNLRLAAYTPMVGFNAPKDIKSLPEFDVPAISEHLSDSFKLKEGTEENRQVSLCLPPHHSPDSYIPTPDIARLICERQTRWGTSILDRGDVRYLAGFSEWSLQVYNKLVLSKWSVQLAGAVHAASFEYSRPNNMYRALCELWCTSTNTFLTGRGEIEISLWEMRDITGLSICGDYYEEIVPRLAELEVSLPKICLYLFKAFSLIAADKNSDRIKHEDWINFWFKKSECAQNPRTSKRFKYISNSAKFQDGKITQRAIISRPFKAEDRHTILVGASEDEGASVRLEADLETKDWEDLEVAAYLVLWLCRFIFPTKDDFIRPGTFKVASKMATGTTYSLVPPILANIYKGLSMTFSPTSKKPNPEIGTCSYFFPCHFLYAWAGLHFPRRVYEDGQQELAEVDFVAFFFNEYHA